MNVPLLSIRDLHIGFRGKAGFVEVLRGVDLTVASGNAWAWSANPAPARA